MEVESTPLGGYQLFLALLRPRVLHEALDVDLRLLLEHPVQGRARGGMLRAEEVADLRTLGNRVRADPLRDPNRLLLIEPEERPEDRESCGLVNRPEVLEGLARHLAEGLAREEEIALLPPGNRLRDPNHKPLREDEVEPRAHPLATPPNAGPT